MVDHYLGTVPRHRITFRRVQGIAPPAYAVRCHQTRVGFVTRLPEGTWLAYLPAGISSDGWSSRAAAAEALHMIAGSVAAAEARSATDAARRAAPRNRPPHRATAEREGLRC